MLNEYIEKVIVHEAIGSKPGKDRKQQVDVYFNFIGNIDYNGKLKLTENCVTFVNGYDKL
ncbi:DUF4368 domain-containing protein [Anaerophilus nitritogenes]|uniref:DUF4368 domain-containing protein n=1 Tax=Anaerophilus nitritogenes TaxID=2498136 RepID=UPI001FAA231C|nr:DUF4368 domain-containing protein [Anaerophilus nitritogenes]